MGLVAKRIFSPWSVQVALAALVLSLFISTEIVSAQAQQYASHQRRNAATGYYSRARALMVEALAEFEQGRKFAQPDLLIDSEEWRLTLISLTEELNRVVDPKPRVTRDGVRFRANPRLISRERNRLPPVPDGAQDSNVYGEQQRLGELQSARARMHSAARQSAPAAESQQPEEQKETQAEEHATRTTADPVNVSPKDVAQPVEPTEELGLSTEPQGTDDEGEDEGAEVAELKVEEKELSEDQKIEAAINEAIRERLKSLENDSGSKS